ncbi:MAG: saccharopine dehydrogenase NADP-binding domain-containing protein [Chloroflexota bacterium]
MATILILGGYGNTGRPLARHLLAQTDADLILAGRNFEKAKAFADELRDSRVTPIRVDASDASSLLPALRGVTICLVAAPMSASTSLIARACLDAGADYLDVQFAASKLAALRALEPEIVKSGRCFITEAGYHPGLPSALVRYAATFVDSVESALTAGYINMEPIPYTETVDELVEAFKDFDARVYKNGAWTKRGKYEIRKIDFGAGIGVKTCYSMYFEELHCLPEMFPTLTETGFYIASTSLLVDTLVTPFIMLGLKLFPKRGVRPLGRLVWWSMVGLGKPPYRLVLMGDVKGRRDGAPTRVTVKVEHSDGYELTAIPVVACLLQLLDGSARKPGLRIMGHIVDPTRLMDDMQSMGVTVTSELT